MTLIAFINTLIFFSCVCLLGFFANSAVNYICKAEEGSSSGLSSLPLFFILGAGTYVFYETFFSISGIKNNILHFVLLCAAFFLLNIILSRPQVRFPYFGTRGLIPKAFSAHNKGARRMPAGIFSIVIAGVILILLFISLLMAMAFPQFDIDMAGHILMKAKLFTNETYKSAVFVHDRIFSNIHSRYPPFAGMFFSLLFIFGGNTVSCYQIVNYLIFLLLGISIYFYLKNNIPLWQAWIWLFIFMSTRGYISSQFIMDSTDLLLSLSFLSAALWLIEFYKRPARHRLVMCAVLSGFAALIKNEALLFSIVTAVILARLNRKALFVYLPAWLIISLPWILYRYTLPGDNSPEALIKITNITEVIKHIKPALSDALAILAKEWNSVFILWLPALVILLRSKYRKDALIFSIITAVFLFVYFTMLCLQLGRQVNYRTVFFRILCQVYPLAFICLALAVKQLLDRGSRRIKTSQPFSNE